MLISLDTETTGVDLRHGAKPFFVTIAKEDGEQLFWEWKVDPITREPQVLAEDLTEIWEEIETADAIVLQNTKFDVTALASISDWSSEEFQWPWHKTYDTLLAGHLLYSNQPHDLTSMVLHYLGVDISPYEETLKVACNRARALARSKLPNWAIAKAGRSDMPGAKETPWKYDMWLPHTLAVELEYEANHPWHTLLQEYSNADSAVTLPLWVQQRQLIEQRGLWRIYTERMKVLPIAYAMESRGVTVSARNLFEMKEEFQADSMRAVELCCNLATSCGHELEMPKSGNNNSLKHLVFNVLKLPPVRRTDTGQPSLDAATLEHYIATLPANSKPLLFVKTLKDKRKRDTAISYMESYERFWLPCYPEMDGEARRIENTFVLHPKLNPTGTHTLRWSCASPNEQNISKQEGVNIRRCFGPAPGREWWSLDAENIELRIPAYAAREEVMIQLFERPNDPPYYGSNHLLACHILHPEKFEECRNEQGEIDGRIFKKKYASTWYQWTKNGNFAVQYGAIEASGTADRAYHVPGGQRLIETRFSGIKRLNQQCIQQAENYGYIETMPDKTVDPRRGYPLLCTRTQWGGVLPTVPLNYYVQGTAMWWMMKAMIRCYAQLEEWRLSSGRYASYLIMQVHDELVFDLPRRANPKVDSSRSNLSRVTVLRDLMRQGGEDIGVPTPVSVTYHPDNWSEGITL